jgi:hypothetical protein
VSFKQNYPYFFIRDQLGSWKIKNATSRGRARRNVAWCNIGATGHKVVVVVAAAAYKFITDIYLV